VATTPKMHRARAEVPISAAGWWNEKRNKKEKKSRERLEFSQWGSSSTRHG